MQEPGNNALRCWCYVDQDKSRAEIISKIERQNHIWVTERETEEEDKPSPDRMFQVQIQEFGKKDSWKLINDTKKMNEMSQDKICSQAGCLDLGSINIGLECSAVSIEMRLVPLKAENSKGEFDFRDNEFVLGECKAQKGKSGCACKCKKCCNMSSENEIEISMSTLSMDESTSNQNENSQAKSQTSRFEKLKGPSGGQVEKAINCILEAVREGNIVKSEALDFAEGLHVIVRGRFIHADHKIFDERAMRDIFSDFFDVAAYKLSEEAKFVAIMKALKGIDKPPIVYEIEQACKVKIGGR